MGKIENSKGERGAESLLNSASAPSLQSGLTIEIEKRLTLTGIPSASGIEVLHGEIFVIGDDCSTLFQIDNSGKVLSEVSLFNSSFSAEHRIPKGIKPDFEALTQFEFEGKEGLLALGSGSKDRRRDTGYWIALFDSSGKRLSSPEIREFSLTKLYDTLRADKIILGDGKLNIEACCVTKTALILFQRRNSNGENAQILIDRKDFGDWLRDTDGDVPKYATFNYTLPKIERFESGFSGAVTLPNQRQALVTASIENTSDAEEDGDVLGSAVAVVPLFEDKQVGKQESSKAEAYAFVSKNGRPLRIKIESIALFEKIGESQYRVLAVTDDDQGGSELLIMRLTIDTPPEQGSTS